MKNDCMGKGWQTVPDFFDRTVAAGRVTHREPAGRPAAVPVTSWLRMLPLSRSLTLVIEGDASRDPQDGDWTGGELHHAFGFLFARPLHAGQGRDRRAGA